MSRIAKTHGREALDSCGNPARTLRGERELGEGMAMRGALFDFNGTMIDDRTMQESSWREFLANKIGRDVADEEFHGWVHGRNADVIFPHFLGRPLSRQEIASLEEEKEVIYRRDCLADPEHFRLLPGLPEFLDLLAERGVGRTIATASNHTNVVFFFEELGLDRWFDPARVVFSDGTFEGKPAPDIYLAAAGRIGVPIGECAVFEDSRSGVRAGRRSGARPVVGIATMFPAEDLRSFGADEVLSDYRGASALLGGPADDASASHRLAP